MIGKAATETRRSLGLRSRSRTDRRYLRVGWIVVVVEVVVWCGVSRLCVCESVGGVCRIVDLIDASTWRRSAENPEYGCDGIVSTWPP